MTIPQLNRLGDTVAVGSGPQSSFPSRLKLQTPDSIALSEPLTRALRGVLHKLIQRTCSATCVVLKVSGGFLFLAGR